VAEAEAELREIVRKATHESDEHNVALALLIAGIAAIESDSQRQEIAYCAIERALSKSPCIVEAMNKLVKQWRGRKIRGAV